MKNIICVNVGNTHTQLVHCINQQILSRQHLKSDDLLSVEILNWLKSCAPQEIRIASVRPDLRVSLEQKWIDFKLDFLTWEKASQWLDFSKVTPQTIGADRLANAIAAIHLRQTPAIIIDFGTCITTEIIDIDGTFCGGAILPGRLLLRKALHHHTAQLPLVELTSDLPADGFGTNTNDAIQCVDLACFGGIKELLTQTMKTIVHPKWNIYATGGDAPYFIKAFDEIEMIHKPDLTLEGLIYLS